MQQIDTAGKRGICIELYFRYDKKDDYRDQCRELDRFGVNLYAFWFLHSKIYANASCFILSSMNLVEISASNNEEFAIRLDNPNL